MKKGKVWQNPIEVLDRTVITIEVHEDKYPVTEGHLLFVPQSLKRGFREMAQNKCDGFNVGINWGEAAGQTVAWPPVHLIPRRKGDMEDPRGGVRGVIPEKQKY